MGGDRDELIAPANKIALFSHVAEEQAAALGQQFAEDVKDGDDDGLALRAENRHLQLNRQGLPAVHGIQEERFSILGLKGAAAAIDDRVQWLADDLTGLQPKDR